jgi:hypothetical protein
MINGRRMQQIALSLTPMIGKFRRLFTNLTALMIIADLLLGYPETYN